MNVDDVEAFDISLLKNFSSATAFIERERDRERAVRDAAWIMMMCVCTAEKRHTNHSEKFFKISSLRPDSTKFPNIDRLNL